MNPMSSTIAPRVAPYAIFQDAALSGSNTRQPGFRALQAAAGQLAANGGRRPTGEACAPSALESKAR
jgi:hypothetical protein